MRAPARGPRKDVSAHILQGRIRTFVGLHSTGMFIRGMISYLVLLMCLLGGLITTDFLRRWLEGSAGSCSPEPQDLNPQALKAKAPQRRSLRSGRSSNT